MSFWQQVKDFFNPNISVIIKKEENRQRKNPNCIGYLTFNPQPDITAYEVTQLMSRFILNSRIYITDKSNVYKQYEKHLTIHLFDRGL